MYRAFILLLMLCNSLLASANYKEVSFIQATPEEVFSTLNATGQYSLVYFTADWCMPCQILEEGHFRDERVINLINNGLLSVKADYSERNDIEWFERYEVNILPTLLILDQNGKEVNRLQNVKDTRELYLFLHRYSHVPITPSKPIALNFEEKQGSAIEASKRKSDLAISSNTFNKGINTRLISNTSTQNNIYNVDIDGYHGDLSIQFAAYTKYDNALKYLNALLEEGMHVSIVEEYVKGKKYFKIVQQATKSNIKSLYNQYRSEGKECFIRPAKVNL